MIRRRVASLAGAIVVAAIAALASYSHMRAVALRYGQPELIADLLPVSVDGMMAVATIALGDGRRNRWSAWLAFWTGVAASVLANVLAAEPSTIARCISAWPAIAFVLVVEVITRGGDGQISAGNAPNAVPQVLDGERPDPAEPARPVREPSTRRGPKKPAANGVRRPIAQTRELAAKVRAQYPQISQAELARRLGISATRLRQVDRGEVHAELSGPVNGNGSDLAVVSEVAS
jgi:hypothetical protein